MRRLRYASLLDDPFFIAELDRLDLPLVESVDETDDGDPPVVEAVDVDDDLAAWCSQLPGPVEPVTVVNEGSAGRIVLGLAGFVLMMGIGAAAAALVFGDRVALILGN